MKKTIFAFTTIIGITLFLSACQGGIHREDVGTVVGAVGGGFAGSALTGGSTLGTIGGAVGGGYIGREVARSTY